MEIDPDVFVAGEDVGANGGVFGSFAGLQSKFGELRFGRHADQRAGDYRARHRRGRRRAAADRRSDVHGFLLVAMDQIANQAAKLKYMFGGKAPLPLTITTSAGAGLSAAAQHSQSLEAMLCHVPGLKVVMPSNPHDAKGLLVAAIRDDNPVIYTKHKRLFGSKGPCPADLFEVPLGVASIARPGSDATIVTYGRMVGESLKAATILAGEDVDVEVIDLRTLQPMDSTTIIASVKRTNHCVVVHEAVRFAGLGAEIAAQVQEEAFDYLDAPVGRIAAPFSPVPFSPPLEAAYVPDAARIAQGVRAALARG